MTRSEIVEKYFGQCFYCGVHVWEKSPDYWGEWDPAELAEIDHRIPKSRGGLDTPWNLVLSCRRCNRHKGDKTDEEYRAYIALHRQRYLESCARALRKIAHRTYTEMTEHLVNLASCMEILYRVNLSGIRPHEVVFYGETRAAKMDSRYKPDIFDWRYDGPNPPDVIWPGVEHNWLQDDEDNTASLTGDSPEVAAERKNGLPALNADDPTRGEDVP